MTARRDTRRDMRVAIVGAGVMAEAMIAGLLADRPCPSRLVASHPRRDRRDRSPSGTASPWSTRNAEAVAGCRHRGAGREAADAALRHAGGRVRRWRRARWSCRSWPAPRCGPSPPGSDHAAVVRAMPNTPSQIRRGITVWAASSACTARQRELARSVLRAIGSEKEVGDETFVAMATALSGTGPTYLFAVMEALIDAGVHMGFPRELAHDLVVETLIGSAEYAAQSELHPAQLRKPVTSPGGTSAAAIYELEKGGIRTVLSDAVWAAYRRTLSSASASRRRRRQLAVHTGRRRRRWYGQADVRHRHGRRRRHAALAALAPPISEAAAGADRRHQPPAADGRATGHPAEAARHLRHHLAGARARHPGAAAAAARRQRAGRAAGPLDRLWLPGWRRSWRAASPTRSRWCCRPTTTSPTRRPSPRRMRQAISAAERGYLVTLGVVPTHAATGYGYIKVGERLHEAVTTALVERFVEKPDAERRGEVPGRGRLPVERGHLRLAGVRLPAGGGAVPA